MIYLDVMFLFNMIADHLVLLLVKEKHYPEIKNRRILAGSFLSAITYIIWYCLFGNLPISLRIILAMLLISMTLAWTYRIRSRHQWERTLTATLFYLFLLGGLGKIMEKLIHIFYMFDINVKSGESGIFLICMILFTVFFIKKERGDRKTEKNKECIYEVQIIRKGRYVSLTGFYDSGNLLVSEITGRGICILPYQEVEKLMNESEKEKVSLLIRQRDFSWKIIVDTLCSGIYKINYSSVGKADGWMPGILAEHIIVKKNGELLSDRGGMIGITWDNISQEGRFAALLPADIFVA